MQLESFERFTPADAHGESTDQAAFWNEARFAALDLTPGRMPSPVVRDILLQGGMTTPTSRVASRGVEWLDEQWREFAALHALGVPLVGFTWFPLGDVIDWRHGLRAKRGVWTRLASTTSVARRTRRPRRIDDSLRQRGPSRGGLALAVGSVSENRALSPAAKSNNDCDE